jgi:hypothetical protein
MMFPKPQKQHKSRAKSSKAQAHLKAVKWLPCVVCGSLPPNDAHHVFHDRYSQAKASDYATIPLCKRHHQVGPEAIHSNKNAWRAYHGSDWSYIPDVLRQLGINTDTDF